MRGFLSQARLLRSSVMNPLGEIEAIGSYVSDYRVGDRVLIHFYQSCGKCHYCRIGRENLCLNLKHFGFNTDGGYAEYAVVGSRHLVKLPPQVSYDACILVDAGATSYHAVNRIARLMLGETAMVMGAGGVGLMLVQMAKIAGANVFAVDVKDEKLELAKKLGADWTINSRRSNLSQEVAALTNGRGVDAAFETVGFEDTYRSCLECLGRGGRLVIIGYQLESYLPRVHPSQLISKENSVLTSRAGTREELVKVVELAGRGRVRMAVTERFPLDLVNEALSRLRKGEIAGRACVTP